MKEEAKEDFLEQSLLFSLTWQNDSFYSKIAKQLQKELKNNADKKKSGELMMVLLFLLQLRKKYENSIIKNFLM